MEEEETRIGKAVPQPCSETSNDDRFHSVAPFFFGERLVFATYPTIISPGNCTSV